MTINEYTVLLNEELKYLPNKKRKFYLNFYQNKMNTSLDEGLDEEKIVDSLPSPFNLAISIYEQENIDYATRRKRKTRSDAYLSLLLGIVILLMSLSGFFLLSYFMVISIIDLIKLMILIVPKEKILIVFLASSIIILYLTLYIYLIDLVILLINMAIEKIAMPFKSDLKLNDFSLIYCLNHLIKKKNFMKFLLISEACLVFVLLVISFATKSYVYRSLLKVEPNNYYQEYKVTDDFDVLKIDIDVANIRVSEGESVLISVKSEFARDLELNVSNNTLNITTDELHNFDLLQILKEPTPLIEIILPKNKSIEFSLNNGMLELMNNDINSLSGQIFIGNVVLEDANIKNLTLKETAAGLSFSNASINEAMIKLYQGKLNIENGKYQNLIITSTIGDVSIEKASIDIFDLTTGGDTSIVDTTINESTVDLASADLLVDGGAILNKLDIKSVTKGNVSIGNLKAPAIKIITISGDVVVSNVTADLDIETGHNATISKISGNLKLKALGNFVSIKEIKGSNVLIETQSAEVSIKYVKADLFKYNGLRSKSTLYFIFGKTLNAYDQYGELLIDNDQLIISSDSDIALYQDYYQDVLAIDVSSNASQRVYIKE